MARKRSHRGGAGPPLAARLAALRARLAQSKADALLLTNPRDIRYLTGFVGDDSWAVVSAGGGKVVVLSDFRFQEQIAAEAPQVQARIRSGKQTLVDLLKRLVERRHIDKLALQAEYTTLATRRAIVKQIGARRLVEAQDGLLAQRSVKTPDEVAAIRRALRIQQEAFEALRETLQPGQTEQEIAASIEYLMRSMGADGPSFPTIAAVDGNASLPHAVSGGAKLRRGGVLLLDWGARWGGYCSDLTRVVALGKMPAKLREIYKVVLDAQLAAIAAIQPGKTGQEVDAAARKLIARAGYGKQFGHGLGHGIGLDIHEEPRLSQRGQSKLEAGQVVTVEPGIYLPGVGGVRIEDDVLVTHRGAVVLSELPKSLESAII